MICPICNPRPQPNCAGASLADGGSPSMEGALGPREWQITPYKLASYFPGREARPCS